MKTYLSIVVVARNDNHGGDFTHRVNVFVKNFLTLSEKYKLSSELIIVEWNPLEDKPSLREAITWPNAQRNHSLIRIIHVPRKIHLDLPNPAKLALFEYVGKNVGVRRARGEYILTTNPDVIFSDELIQFFASGKLSSESFYRISRQDVRSPVTHTLPVAEQLAYCAQNVIRVQGYFGTYDNGLQKIISYHYWRSLLSYLKYRLLNFPDNPPFLNASGDFLVMNRDSWNSLRGYPELETEGKSPHIDGLGVIMAQSSGLRQVILRDPIRLFHQDHGRPQGGMLRSPAVEELYQKIRREKKYFVVNDKNWGLAAHNLPEWSM